MGLSVSLHEEVFSGNITHNLAEMAKEAGLYNVCWRPESIAGCNVYAYTLIPDLAAGLKKLKDNPEYFKKFDAPNGWGTYENFVSWVEKYLEACETYLDAIVHVDR